MSKTTHQTKYIQVIEWVLYFGLCGISVFFMYGVLDNFFSGRTSFTHSDEPVDEFPTIMLCFSKNNWGKAEYEYGSDFKIKYGGFYENGFQHAFLKEGENSTLMEEIIYLEKIMTISMGNCFKITPFLTNTYLKKELTDILIYFNESVHQETFHTLDIFITSERNSYGVVVNEWYNGKVLKTQVKKGFEKAFDLKPEQYQYLATHTKCSYQSFYECASQFTAENFKASSTNCSIVSLPTLPICKSKKSDGVIQEFWRNFDAIRKQCPRKLCSTLQYSGDESIYKPLNDEDETVAFHYKFTDFSPNLKTLYVEYLIYDAITMIGSVGGTLGMCIGFSFTGMISFLINLFQNIIVHVRAKLVNQNPSKSKSQNESMIKTKEREIFKKGKSFNSRIDKCNEHIQTENYLRMENYIEDQIKFEDKLNSNFTKETYPKYWFELKKKVDEILKKVEDNSKKVDENSKKLKILEMKKNI